MSISSILSIDWDYFFPNTAPFDWSASENRFAFFFHKGIWPIRYYQQAFYGPHKGQIAKDIMQPDSDLLNNFWHNVFPHGFDSVDGVAIVESHEDLYTILRAFGEDYTVWNLDAHHDLGYHSMLHLPDCGNWALYGLIDGLIEKYNIVYPAWRKKEPEHNFKSKNDQDIIGNFSPHIGKISFFYDTPAKLSKILPKFDYVFICRSGAWTPAWADHEYVKFIEYWKEKRPALWKRLLSVKGATKARVFDLKSAEEYNKQFENQKKKLFKRAS